MTHTSEELTSKKGYAGSGSYNKLGVSQDRDFLLGDERWDRGRAEGVAVRRQKTGPHAK
jgi:hypothetical protein